MLFSRDRTGFPLIAVPKAGVEIHLLPVTWGQFAQSRVGSALLVARQMLPAAGCERLLVTGVLPEEALAFARWLGRHFDLPTLGEWRAVYAALSQVRLPSRAIYRWLLAWEEQPAGTILERLIRQERAPTLADLALMRGGLVEWVRDRDRWVGLGSPRPELHPNLWDPLHDLVRPLRAGERLPYFGFRLVWRGGGAEGRD